MTKNPPTTMKDSGDSFAPGSHVDNFRVGKLLGEGGMGKVYLARDALLGRKVALKVIRPEALGSHDAVERFFFEARVTASFNHPHIVTVYAVGRHGGCPYLALEYLEGQTLRERLMGERLGHHEAARITLAVAQALEVAHENGVLHRDLKPDNIAIPRDGRLRVLDFGLAKAGRQQNAEVSSPSPGAPETADLAPRKPRARGAQGRTMPGTGVHAVFTPDGQLDEPQLSPPQGDNARLQTIDAQNKQAGPTISLDKTMAPADLPDPLAGFDKTMAPADLPDSLAGFDKTMAPTDLPDSLAGFDKTMALPTESDMTTGSQDQADPAVQYHLGNTVVGAAYRTIEGLVGTPHYMAPEQWQQKVCTPSTDIWALGLILWELLCGEGPLQQLTFAQIAAKIGHAEDPLEFSPPNGTPEELTNLVGRMIRSDPEKRPSAATVARQLEQFLHGELPQDKRGHTPNPFRGLLPFREEHAAFFHGRDAELNAFLERLRSEAVLPVVGPSGAGKSSFVMAGVIPRLRQQGAWQILRIRPGRSPFKALATRLLSGKQRQSSLVKSMLSVLAPAKLASQGPAAAQEASGHSSEDGSGLPSVEELTTELRERPGMLAVLLQRLAEDSRSKVLLYVDQLEELCTLVEDEQQRLEFMQMLCLGADDPEGEVRVLFTLRDDFLGRLAKGEVARETLSRVTVLRAPGEKALEAILTEPLDAVGYRYETPELVQEMLEAVRGEPASLPLLQFASSQLWEQRDRENHILTREVFDSMGGVAGALAHHADGVLEGLAPRELRLTRDLLMRLVNPNGTRVVLPVQEALDGLGDDATSLLQRLVDARIVLVHKSAGGGTADVEAEIIHESLMRNWDRLRRWMDEGRDDLAFLHEVGGAAALWTKRGRQSDAVWTGDALQDALRSLDRCSTEIPTEIEAFLKAGRAKQEHAIAVRRRRRLAVMISLGIVALASIIASLVFFKQKRQVRQQKNRAEQQRHHAQRQQKIAEAQRLRARQRWAEAQREGARAAAGRGDVLEARSKLRGALELQDSPLARALWWKLLRDPVVWRQTQGGLVYSVAFSPDSRRVAVAGQDAVIYLYDIKLRTVLALRGHQDMIFTLAWSPDGTRLASGDWGGKVRVRHLATGKTIHFDKHAAGVWAVRFAPDGRTLATADGRGIIRLWDITTGRLLRTLKGHHARVRSLAFDRRGSRLVSGSYDKRVILWDPKTGRAAQILKGIDTKIYSVALSLDGKWLAAGDYAGKIRLWRLASNSQHATLARTFKAHKSGVAAVAFSPDGKHLASGSRDRTIRLWDVATGHRLGALRGHTDGIYALDFSADGRWLISSGRDKSIRLWNARRFDQAVSSAGGHLGAVHGVAFDREDKIVASVGGDRTLRLWDVATGKMKRVIGNHSAGVRSVAFSPDGALLGTGSYDGLIRLWDHGRNRLNAVLRGHRAPVYSLGFTPRGNKLVSTSGDGTLRFWGLKSRQEKRKIRVSRGAAWSLAMAPNGRWLAAGTQSGTIQILPMEGGATRLLKGHKASVYGLAVSPDGKQLASGSVDRTLRLWNVARRTSKVIGKHPARVYRVAFHPDGRRVVTASSDGYARLWPLAGGPPHLFWGHRGEINGVRFSASGRLMATASDDGTVRLWETETGRPLWRAPMILLDRGAPPTLSSHRGWLRLDTNRLVTPPAKDWRRRLQQRARLASLSPDGRALCLLDHTEGLERWDRASDKRLYRKTVKGIRRVLAVPGGCLTLAAGALHLYDPTGTPRVLVSSGASAMSWNSGRILVAANRTLLSFDGFGKQRQHLRDSDVGVTAILQTQRGLVIGYNDGNIELLPRNTTTARTATYPFEAIPHSPVVALRKGPQGTLVAGYANGLLGIWNLRNGSRFHAVRLHGPVVHLRIQGHRLYAATELGDHRTLDLSVFHLDYCNLLRRVWKLTPTLWEGGLPVLRTPPTNHRCAMRK